MITHERLKELIGQRGTIYWIKDGALRMEIDLALAKITEMKDECCVVWVEHLNNFYCLLPYAELTDDKEDAEFHKEFKRIPRTDYLDLPTWEEFSNGGFCHFITKECKYSLSPNLIHNLIILYEGVFGGGFYIYDKWELTKENYFEACRKAKELFLGEE